jgi:hypothetical protein
MKAVWGSTGSMATLNKRETQRIGVIAEDKSDVEVITVILEKYAAKNTFEVKKFVGNGCGRLRNKCRTWTETLLKAGCTHVLIFHDLDRNEETKLLKTLLNKVPSKEFPNALIVIPIEEMEAWLLADEAAITKTFALKHPLKKIPSPETVGSPKEEIGRIVWSGAKKRYLNTVHNVKIASTAKRDNLLRCTSYVKLDDYLVMKVFA